MKKSSTKKLVGTLLIFFPWSLLAAYLLESEVGRWIFGTVLVLGFTGGGMYLWKRGLQEGVEIDEGKLMKIRDSIVNNSQRTPRDIEEIINADLPAVFATSDEEKRDD